MIVGFNHNISYQGVGFHVQTEDSGLKSPSLVTLLYHGGIIVASQKTSYADMLDVENLSQVVEDLAKEQHKGMLRRLTKGEFDQRIGELGIELGGARSAPQSTPPASEPPAIAEHDQPAADPLAEALFAGVTESPARQADDLVLGDDLPVAIEPAYEPSADEAPGLPAAGGGALDALIYAYLTGGDEKS